jgi:hypothetical protein
MRRLHTVCQWHATSRWFSPGPPIFSTNKTDRHDITEILLIVVLNNNNPHYNRLYITINPFVIGISTLNNTILAFILVALFNVSTEVKPLTVISLTNFNCINMDGSWIHKLLCMSNWKVQLPYRGTKMHLENINLSRYVATFKVKLMNSWEEEPNLYLKRSNFSFKSIFVTWKEKQ